MRIKAPHRIKKAFRPPPKRLTPGPRPASTVPVSYIERPPIPALAGVVRAVWIQRTGDAGRTQRHLPTGGAEIHVPVGGRPRLLGPLTGPVVEFIPARTTILGVRFQPGAAPPLPTGLDDLVDERPGLADLWGAAADRLTEAIALAATPQSALILLQHHLLGAYRRGPGADRLVREAVRSLMPWRPVDVDGLATRLGLSASQLRRRCLRTVGVSPKALQRALRFQGFLALAQAGRSGLASLAMDAGYADQAHLSRECRRLTGLTPSALLGACDCGHEHAASYTPFLAGRG